jgi:hypothetical protein
VVTLLAGAALPESLSKGGVCPPSPPRQRPVLGPRLPALTASRDCSRWFGTAAYAVVTVSLRESAMDVPHTPPEPATVAPAPKQEPRPVTADAQEPRESRYPYPYRRSDWRSPSSGMPMTALEVRSLVQSRIAIQKTSSGLVVNISLNEKHIEAIANQSPPPAAPRVAPPPPPQRPKDAKDAIVSALADSATWIALAIAQAFVGEAGRTAIIRAWRSRSRKPATGQDKDDTDTIEIPVTLVLRMERKDSD